MKYLLFLPFLISCIESPVTEFFYSSAEGRGRLRDRVRSRSLSGSSDYCSKSRQCRNLCEDMYLKAADLDRCYNSKENQVQAVSEVFDILIDPRNLSDLNDIEAVDFSLFLNIGWKGFLDLIDPVHRDEDGDRRGEYWEDIYAYDIHTAQLVLEWIANEEQIARAVSSKDKDLEIIRHLFCIAGRSASPAEYVCDLWGQSGCTAENLNTRFSFINWSSSTSSSCHDHPASLYVALTQGEYDGVAFTTYAGKQENNQAVDLAAELIADLCARAGSEALKCAAVYTCPVTEKYEGGSSCSSLW